MDIHRIQMAKGYAPGKQFEYKTKDLPKGVYQYSIWVPKNYDPKKEYPVVFYLHGGGGRKFPSYGKKNIISDRLIDNQIGQAQVTVATLMDYMNTFMLHQ